MMAGVNAAPCFAAGPAHRNEHDHLLRIRHRRLKPRHDLRKVDRSDTKLRNPKTTISAALPVPSADAPQ